MASRTRRVVWARRALIGLHEILHFVSRESPSGAQVLCSAILSRASSLDTLSHRGRVVPEIASPDVREAIIKRYRLIYEVHSEEVVILAVLHGARDFSKWRREQ